MGSESRPPATYVTDLRPNRVATLEAQVAEVGPVREVMLEKGISRKVQEARLRDKTGEVTLVLWGSEVDRVHSGERVRILEGWVRDYKGRLQISLGRTGKVEVLSTGSSP